MVHFAADREGAAVLFQAVKGTALVTIYKWELFSVRMPKLAFFHEDTSVFQKELETETSTLVVILGWYDYLGRWSARYEKDAPISIRSSCTGSHDVVASERGLAAVASF